MSLAGRRVVVDGPDVEQKRQRPTVVRGKRQGIAPPGLDESSVN